MIRAVADHRGVGLPVGAGSRAHPPPDLARILRQTLRAHRRQGPQGSATASGTAGAVARARRRCSAHHAGSRVSAQSAPSGCGDDEERGGRRLGRRLGGRRSGCGIGGTIGHLGTDATGWMWMVRGWFIWCGAVRGACHSWRGGGRRGETRGEGRGDPADDGWPGILSRIVAPGEIKQLAIGSAGQRAAAASQRAPLRLLVHSVLLRPPDLAMTGAIDARVPARDASAQQRARLAEYQRAVPDPRQKIYYQLAVVPRAPSPSASSASGPSASASTSDTSRLANGSWLSHSHADSLPALSTASASASSASGPYSPRSLGSAGPWLPLPLSNQPELPCLFTSIGCPERSPSFTTWCEHSEVHFHARGAAPPRNNTCPFCPDFTVTNLDAWQSWTGKLRHIYGVHLVAGERLTEVDLESDLLRALWQKHIITQEHYHSLVQRQTLYLTTTATGPARRRVAR